MSLVARLRRLDSRFDLNLRREGETADEFLRRMATGTWSGRPLPSELQAALREHFDKHNCG